MWIKNISSFYLDMLSDVVLILSWMCVLKTSLPCRLSIGLSFLDLLFLERESQKTKTMLLFSLVEKVYRQSI